MLQSISLAQAWPYIISVFVAFSGVLAYFVRRYIERNDSEHAALRVDVKQQLCEICDKNAEQHKEFYERVNGAEIKLSALEAHCKAHNENNQ